MLFLRKEAGLGRYRYIFLFALVATTRSYAPPVEILYRPGITAVSPWNILGTAGGLFDKNPLEAAGHVAIRLPPGKFGLGHTVYGWTPRLDGHYGDSEPTKAFTPKERLTYLSNLDPQTGNWRTLPGTFANNEAWALEGTTHTTLPIYSIPVNLTDAQLETLQFSPARTRTYAPQSYNCATAVLGVFEGTGVDLSFLPRRGDIPSFHRAAQASGLAKPWVPCELFHKSLSSHR
jgi:hypothetical protein